MNSIERVAAAIHFQPTDRPPVIAQVFGHAAVLCETEIGDYVRSGETLAKCQLFALRKYGYDAVFSVMDANVETEAAGSVLRFFKNQYPVVRRYGFSIKDDWSAPACPDPLTAGRMPEMLKALGILRNEAGGRAAIIGCVLGPFTLAAQLMGLEAALYLAADAPARLELLMDFATDIAISFGRAQIRAGAHLPMVFDPSGSPAVIPPGFFREFELPRLKRIFTALADEGAVANWLHIAGPVKPILPYYGGDGRPRRKFRLLRIRRRSRRHSAHAVP